MNYRVMCVQGSLRGKLKEVFETNEVIAKCDSSFLDISNSLKCSHNSIVDAEFFLPFVT